MIRSLLFIVPALAGYLWLSNSSDISEPMDSYANTPMSRIEMSRIPQEEIRDFIKSQIKNDVNEFDELTATYRQGDSLSKFNFHEKEYRFDFPKDVLWRHYLSANPSVAWNGDMVSFGLMVSKQDGEVMYKGEDYQGIKVGQVMFINIEVLGGLIKIPVAHEIIAVDLEKTFLEFSYVKGGKSAGKQRITFYENNDGTTRINHTTYYRSASAFRDKVIYPFFHTQAIDDYHENMITTLKSSGENASL